MSTEQSNSPQMTNESTEKEPSPDTETAADPSAAPETEHPDDIEALTEEVEHLAEEVEELKDERDELNDRLLRKAAEFENFQRRMKQEKKRRHRAGKERVIESMLKVMDDFERALDAAEDLDEAEDVESAYDSLKGGVEMVFRKFRDELQSFGVEPIEAEGEPFDEHLHEAMMRQPTDDAEPGTVLQEIRRGYTMGDRVLRHSRVVVAAEPSENGEADDASA
ncbi:MAG: nucleotide exchange factor GrpE [Salinibacter sp.]